MKNLLTYLLLLSFAVVPVFSQKEDPAGKKIMEEFTQITQSYPGIKISFTFTYIDLADKSENDYSGTFDMKGSMYLLNLNNTEIYFDGKTLWNYLPDEEEVNISEPAEGSEGSTDFDNPARFFTLLGKDFFTKFIANDVHEGKTVQVVDLYPKDLNKPYSRIRLQIFKESHQLFSAHYFGKDGIQYILKVNRFNTPELPDSHFRFDPARHPEVEVIDLR